MLRSRIGLSHRFSSFLCRYIFSPRKISPKSYSTPIWVADFQRYASDKPSQCRYPTISCNEGIEYQWVNGVERLELYKPGGYHPVMIDDLLDHGRYRIVDKLGFGGYSTIWLARDEQLNRYVAVKINISDHPRPRSECHVLRKLASKQEAADLLPMILDDFEIQGPNGTHACYTTPPAEGNLKEASFSRLFPIHVARALSAKLALSVSLVHSQGYVHGDIHLRNALVRLSSSNDQLSILQFREKYGEPETEPVVREDGRLLSSNVPAQVVVPLDLGKKAQDFTLDDARRLVLSDFGETFAPATERRIRRECNTPLAKRAPEALFEPDAPLSLPSDIWSLGTAIWEILGMKFIFSESETADEIIAQQIDVLGSQHFPSCWAKQWERSRSDKEAATAGRGLLPLRPTAERERWPPLEEAFEEFVQKYRRKRAETIGVFDDDETRAILALMRSMLKFSPQDRVSIDEVLGSEWMVKWALPALDLKT